MLPRQFFQAALQGAVLVAASADTEPFRGTTAPFKAVGAGAVAAGALPVAASADTETFRGPTAPRKAVGGGAAAAGTLSTSKAASRAWGDI